MHRGKKKAGIGEDSGPQDRTEPGKERKPGSTARPTGVYLRLWLLPRWMVERSAQVIDPANCDVEFTAHPTFANVNHDEPV